MVCGLYMIIIMSYVWQLYVYILALGSRFRGLWVQGIWNQGIMGSGIMRSRILGSGILGSDPGSWIIESGIREYENHGPWVKGSWVQGL